MTPLILGSQSPRRKAILQFFSLPFRQVHPDFDEEALPFTGDPISYAQKIAQGKALSLVHNHPNQIILTADTVVYCEGRIFLKPQSKENALESLSFLAGRWHSVFTALTACKDREEYTLVEETKVLFNPLTTQQIELFLEKMPYKDKAGSYFIQDEGCLLARKIEGCFYNVMGLPINALSELLTHFNIDLWNFLQPPPSL